MGSSQAAALVGGFIPALVPNQAVAWAGPAIPAWLTPLTCTLLHGSVLHLLFNLGMLVYCGRETERALGSVGVLILYLVGAYAAAAGQWVQNPLSTVPTIGASGAIAAIIAAYALLYGRNRVRAVGPLSASFLHALWLGAAWTIINLLINLAMLSPQPVAVGAHIGGFLAGLILTRPILLWRYRKA
ncbi:rhomboid family intramembrane serine protease [Sphingomonas panacisoli]|uniref:Rhomboid family intramembrane serine protease n=2 Tax=Sphingomonas panacisoli TaxID=1813879 RepID=A0A5B8LLI1_9SPHN|nr:rhomboid family intramembrane serine protease [Sphingomonas panacisoli]QDZ09088.1 rhomboid family intramembrane serine protease [Sphingomonas panacisoli]